MRSSRFIGTDRIARGLLVAAICIGAALTAGCSNVAVPFLTDLDLPLPPIPHVLRIVDTVDQPSNMIERALSQCDQRIPAGEAACVKRALVEQKVTIPGLLSMLHACREGQVCHYVYTTNDRVGLVPATADHYIVRWQVDFDLSHAAKSIDMVPISVVQI